MKVAALATALSCCIAAQQFYPGLGTWTHPIATRSTEAQKYFDQGLILLYGFNRPEALRSFRKALAIDPQAAMAQWGVAMALGPYINMDMDSDVHLKGSCAAAQSGLSMEGIGAVDRAWLQAAAARCPNYSDPQKYIGAMRELAARFPDDPDAQTFYADALLLPARWRWYDNAGKPADGVAEAEHVLEHVLRRFPDHPGANHLYIHAVESSPTPERAIASAQRLMGIVPGAGHMVHMPGHIWLVLGDYNTAADVNERAAEVDREYFARAGEQPDYYLYYLHNLQFILYARAMQGRVAQTRAAIAQFEKALQPMQKDMPEMAEAFGVFATMARVRVGLWDELLTAPAAATPLTATVRHYARALASAAQSQPQQARTERAQFEAARAQLDRSMPWGLNKLGDVVDLASAVLGARLADSPHAAVPLWQKAVALQDALAYDEPPAWYYPVRESLGAALLRSGDAAGAEIVFREGLRRTPHNGRILFGLLESLKAQNKSVDAHWVEREFRTAWKGADLPLRLADL